MVQLPEGNPLSTTLPVDTVHVGCVMVPTVGAEGVEGWALITTLAEADEVHPAALVTLNVHVEDAFRPVIIVLVPIPEVVVPPGVCVMIHVPVAGRPLNITLPVAVEHVGCVIVPTVGAEGVEG